MKRKIIFILMVLLSFYVFAEAKGKVPTYDGKTYVVDGMKLNKATFQPELQKKISEIIKVLNDDGYIYVKVFGHASSDGSKKYNLALSVKRAMSAREYLISKGVPADRIAIEGKGVDFPVASNSTEEGRSKNRRIEISLVYAQFIKKPMKPVILGVTEGEIKSKDVLITVAQEEGVEYTAEIDNQPYSLGTDFTTEGKHTIFVVARNTANNLTNENTLTFEIDKKGPPRPIITGVKHREVTTMNPKVDVERVDGVEYTSKIDDEPFILGTEYGTEGKHVVWVTARKIRNNMTSESIVNFELDKTGPKPPVIKGVYEGEVKSKGGAIDLECREDGVEYTMQIDNAPFIPGTVYSENGLHTVVAIANKIKNGLTSTTQLKFEIDKDGPAKPVITGVKDGETARKSPKIDAAEKQEGVEYTAIINGKPFELGTEYKNNREQNVTVIAKKLKNNLTTESSLTFEFDRSVPVTVRGKEVSIFGGESSAQREGKPFTLVVKGGPNFFGKVNEKRDYSEKRYENNIIQDSLSFSKNTNTDLDGGINFNIGLEVYKELLYFMDIGIGFNYETPLEVNKKTSGYVYTKHYDNGIERSEYDDDENKTYSNIPIYLLARVKNYVAPSINTYVVGRLGYNLILADKGDFQNYTDREGGLYLGGGVGVEVDRFQVELLYAASTAKFKKSYTNTYNLVNRDEYSENMDRSYQRLSLNFGYILY